MLNVICCLLIQISQVDRFVSKINTTLRLRHEKQKLDSVLNRIESYCPIEATEEVDKVCLHIHIFIFN